MILQGHPWSLILAQIEGVYGTSYWFSIVTLVLPCRVSEILKLLHAESHFFSAPTLPSGVAKSKYPRLTVSKSK